MATVSDRVKHNDTVVRELEKLYPNAKSELNFSSPYQLVIAVALSAQCTDKLVNQVTPGLFSRFPDFQALSEASLPEVEKVIGRVNYFKTKSRNIIALAQRVVSTFAGELPKNKADLTSLPGVGNKTANVVLGELELAPAFPVDTHVFRVSKRLKIAQGKDVTAVEKSLCKAFAPHLWRKLHHALIYHGRRVCKAQRPLCGSCSLKAICPTGPKNDNN